MTPNSRLVSEDSFLSTSCVAAGLLPALGPEVKVADDRPLASLAV